MKAAQGCSTCLPFISPGADMAKMLAGKVALITGGLPKAIMVLQKLSGCSHVNIRDLIDGFRVIKHAACIFSLTVTVRYRAHAGPSLLLDI